MAARYCVAAGKVAYVRHQEAEKVIALHAKRCNGSASRPLSPYRCVVCRRWHLTGLTPEEAADHRRARGTPPPPKKAPRLRPKTKRKTTPKPPRRKPK